MKIVGNIPRTVSFCNKKNSHNDDTNPISKLGENQNLLLATVIAGLGLGARALFYLAEDTTVLERAFEISTKLVDKNKKNVKGKNKMLMHLGGWALVMGLFIAGFAALYTLFKTPEIRYKGKVNSFVKGKDMDVYIKSNKVETELYNQMNEKAEKATEEEKKVLSQQYLKLKAAKNQVPDSIKDNRKKGKV
jgi:hypothetical protein